LLGSAFPACRRPLNNTLFGRDLRRSPRTCGRRPPISRRRRPRSRSFNKDDLPLHHKQLKIPCCLLILLYDLFFHGVRLRSATPQATNRVISLSRLFPSSVQRLARCSESYGALAFGLPKFVFCFGHFSGRSRPRLKECTFLKPARVLGASRVSLENLIEVFPPKEKLPDSFS